MAAGVFSWYDARTRVTLKPADLDNTIPGGIFKG